MGKCVKALLNAKVFGGWRAKSKKQKCVSQSREFQDDSRSRKEIRQTIKHQQQELEGQGGKNKFYEVSWVVGRKAFLMAWCK